MFLNVYLVTEILEDILIGFSQVTIHKIYHKNEKKTVKLPSFLSSLFYLGNYQMSSPTMGRIRSSVFPLLICARVHGIYLFQQTVALVGNIPSRTLAVANVGWCPQPHAKPRILLTEIGKNSCIEYNEHLILLSMMMMMIHEHSILLYWRRFLLKCEPESS